MKCPHCGNELKEGYLICEKCGEEIRIVPDFEPEIENSITETLSTLASMQEEKTQKKCRRWTKHKQNSLQSQKIWPEAGLKRYG